jgi:hypothetical protein
MRRQQHRAQRASRGRGQGGGPGHRPADPNDELWIIGDPEYLAGHDLPGGLDLDGLRERGAGQAQRGGGEEDRTACLPGTQPVQRLVPGSGDHE